MSCSPFDLRDYFLKELPEIERRQVEAHVRDCVPCREEMDRLGLTQAALFALREEEIPQRIAFVSDAVFEPSAWRRVWSALWNSGPRLGFVSAAMLSAALVVFSLTRPAPVAVPVGSAAAVHMSDTEIQMRIDAAVARAVAVSDQKQAEQTQTLRAALEEYREQYELDLQRQATVASTRYDMPQSSVGAPQ